MKTNIHFFIISRSVLIRVRNVLGKLFRENQDTLCVQYCFFQSRPVCDIILEKYCRAGQAQIKIWLMRIACWIPKATDTHPLCIILLFHCNYGCTNAPQCYVTRTSPASLKPRRSV